MFMTDWKNIFEQSEALRTMPELTSDQAREWVVAELGVTADQAGCLIYAGLKRQIIFKSPMRTLCGVDAVWRPGTAGMGAIGSPAGGIGRVCGNSQNIPSFRKKNCSSLS
jgi:hypothetical protein